jgi:drug/metabolite transporter (DMT)-like permease
MSVVYPVARGLAPLLLVVAAVAGLGGAVGALQVVGVALIVAGVTAVRGVRSRLGAPDLLLAGGVAACIAAYTLVDREGVRHAAPVPYLWLVLVMPAVVYSTAIAARRGTGVLRAVLGRESLVAGIGMLGAFALVLAALRLAPAAAVSAVRETSVVIAVALARVVLGEDVGPRRLGGAVVVAGGIALVALG